jgi:RNA polymerase sigma-70 factor (ECF subfamily)
MSARDAEERMHTLDLVAEARQGSSSSLAALYERCAPMVVAWAEMRIRPSLRASIDGDDLLQETWLRVVEGFERYDASRQAFRPWLLGIARNVLFEHLRRVARARVQRNEPLAGKSSLEERRAAELTTIRTRLARIEELDEFRASIAELDEIDRAILLHCGFEELAIAEAASRLGLNVESCGKRWQRLRAKLRESRFARRFELQLEV